MRTEISLAASRKDVSGLAALTKQYLEWDRAEFERLSGISLDITQYLENTLSHLDDYMPPMGRIIMGRDEAGALIGFVILKKLADDAAEIKRFYVTAAGRGTGLGRRLMEVAVNEARRLMYTSIYLESATYMPAAHRIYRSAGFEEVGPYPGNEYDASFLPYLVFMRLSL